MIVATASTCKTSSFFAGLMVRYSCSDIHGLLLQLVSPPVACCDSQHLLVILQHACSVCAETAEHACSGISAQTEDAWSGFRRRSVCSEILQHACSVFAETAVLRDFGANGALVVWASLPIPPNSSSAPSLSPPPCLNPTHRNIQKHACSTCRRGWGSRWG